MRSARPPKKFPEPEALQKTGWQFDVEVAGHSMEPLLRTGDIVTVVCVTADQCRAGDLICFKQGGGFFLHRLLEHHGRDGTLLYEKGDAELGGRWIQARQLIGRVERINGRPLDESYRERALLLGRAERIAVTAVTGAGPLKRTLRSLKRPWTALKKKVLRSP